jgi:putative hydrolase of the HAD superfamily
VKQSIQAVFFDFDDTLGDRESYAYDCAKAILKENTEIADPIEFEAVLQDWMLWDEKGNIDKNHIARMLQKKYQIALPYSDLNTYWDEQLWKYCVPYKDAKETLTYLKEKYILGVITNGPSIGQRKKIEICGLSSFFAKENITVSGDGEHRKPDIEIFLDACRRAGVQPQHSVYIGDIYANDILGSQRAGMQSIWMWSAGNRKQSTSMPMIHSLSELKDLL